MSERQKEFYANNPEKIEEMSRVLKKAWNVFGADHIKKAMSKFLRARKLSEIDVENPMSVTKEQAKALKDFWGQNEWAKKSFSKNMKYAWKKVKEENETFLTLKTTPTGLIKFIERKANLPEGSLNCDTVFNPYTATSSIDEKSNEIIKENLPKGIENVMADTYQLAIFNIVSKMKDMKVSKKDKAFQELLGLSALTIKNNTLAKGGYKVQYTEEAQQDFLALASYAATSKKPELVNIINEALDEAFELSLSVHSDCILK
jgi:hypothetical protein